MMTIKDSSISRELGRAFQKILALNNVDLEREGSLLLYRLQRSSEQFVGAMCLDAGCGRGEACYAMSSLGARIGVGVDVGDHVTDAKDRNTNMPTVEVVKGDIETLPFASNRFDVVHCSGVIHHCAHPQRVFAELVRFLAAGNEDIQRTRSERYDYRTLLSRLWWGTGWIQLSGFKGGFLVLPFGSEQEPVQL